MITRSARQPANSASAWRRELGDLIHGASGGFLFGIPLLYTMEVWWIGSASHPARLLLILLFSFAIIFVVNRSSGFRRMNDIRSAGAAMESIEALAIGIICTGVTMLLLREISPAAPLGENLGKLIYESVPFTLGVALANQYLGAPDEDDASRQSSNSSIVPMNATIADVGATMLGAIIIGSNIAPTDEIPMLAAAISGLWLLAIMAASLLISYSIVFAAGFGNQSKRHQQKGIFQRPLSETFMSYLVSLLVAAAMLFFFNRVSFSDPWYLWLSQTLTLGLPTTIGGAAGRLAI